MAINNAQATAEMYSRVFENGEGAIILDDLTVKFGGNLFVRGGEEGRRQTDFNLGRRQILDFIYNKINQAHGLPINEDEPEQIS